MSRSGDCTARFETQVKHGLRSRFVSLAQLTWNVHIRDGAECLEMREVFGLTEPFSGRNRERGAM